VGSVTTLSSLVRMMYSRAGAYPADQPMLYAEDFSPNTPQGACSTCHGLGHVYEVTEALMVPDPSLSIRERAIASWPPAWHGQNLRDILVTLGYDIDVPWKKLPKKDRDWILFTEEAPSVPVYAGFTPAETRAALKRKQEPSYMATQLSSLLFGVLYVLDEPSAGLHPADSQALYDALEGLRDGGNSVFVVEHDLELMRRAQWLVDVGPEAGEHGGQVLYSGEPDGLRQIQESRTAQYLFDKVPAPASRQRNANSWLELKGIHRHNLQGVDAQVPLALLTAVTGISGSGKSSLMAQALPELLLLHLGHEPAGDNADSAPTDGPTVIETTLGTLAGDVDAIQRVVQVDQKPIGRTPRSNLATYTGLFDHVRKLFAATPAARRRRFDAGRFSFNVTKGRCETCEGEGFVSVELLFMPSVYAPCPTCHGARYNDATLKVQWNDRNIAEVLQMTVDQAHAFFSEEEAIARRLQLLQEIGLGYLRLGQPATELSGGEAQRIKLATELQRSQRGRTLYVLDEPTTGLHASDVDRLLVQLQRLVDAGNTVVMIEHDMRAVAQADWVIDVGPGAGGAGGTIVAKGTPQQVARAKGSRTAAFLARELGQGG